MSTPSRNAPAPPLTPSSSPLLDPWEAFFTACWQTWDEVQRQRASRQYLNTNVLEAEGDTDNGDERTATE